MSGHNLSNRILNLAESETIAMARLSRQLKADGHDVISLSLGEPDFDTPTDIREAAKHAIDQGFSHYPPVAGYPDLQASICAKLKRDTDLNYNADQIVVSTGAKQSIANICLSMLDPGDEVLIPAPYWVSYLQIVQLAGATAKFIPTSIEDDFKASPEAIEAAITEKTKLLIYSSPCNPSGSVYNSSELDAIAKMLDRHPHVFIISDEIYEHIIFDGKHESIATRKNMYDRVAVVNGVSKSHAMTGWRIGYMAGPKWLAAACDKMQGQFTSAPSGISQRAAKAAVEADLSMIKPMKDAFKKRRDIVIDLLNKIEGVKVNKPNGAFYLFPDVSSYFGKRSNGKTIENSSELCMYLLNDAKVSLVTGAAFGDPNCIRISYASSEEQLKEAMKRISISFSKLK
ncbi:MAG: pyridoxal phosphate-dependent aminotransferase [Bacteroidia bacterium]|nr:pyridoxal phosphate-dependent aminotransferase [Bacteroidia bacterium]